ncbi:MAG: pyruvate formate-lyase-activating protein [Spirochaetaceae bacterium]
MSAYRTLPLSRRPARRPERSHSRGPAEGGAVTLASHPEAAPTLSGHVHSVESFGTLDGPGIRYVIFFQGCHLQCLFCQNRDTWERRAGRVVTVKELMGEIQRYKPYMRSSGGGITASGGDPILQPRFVTELFRAARAEGIHTALDTSGVTAVSPAVVELVAETDLVLLDIKQIDTGRHRELTGHGNERVLAFARFLDSIRKPVWIRHVIVPGYTDSNESARETAAFLAGLSNVERVELLPYHAFGSHKWEALGEAYPLGDVAPPSSERMEELKAIFRAGGVSVK